MQGQFPFARDHLRVGSLAPDLQLLDRSGSERVACRHHNLVPFIYQEGADLPDAGSFANAVNANK